MEIFETYLNDFLYDLKSETLQLHVGQEAPDPVTDARAIPIQK